MTRSFLPVMLKAGDKQIMNIKSIAAHDYRPGFSAYQPAKLAIVRFSELINVEYGDQGVLSYAVHLAKALPVEFHGCKCTHLLYLWVG